MKKLVLLKTLCGCAQQVSVELAPDGALPPTHVRALIPDYTYPNLEGATSVEVKTRTFELTMTDTAHGPLYKEIAQ